MPRAVIYARFSTDRQDKLTNEAQIEQCTKYALSRGFDIVGIFQDEATSGSDYFSREQVQAALALFKTGSAEILICTSPDRLSRDVEHTEKILKAAEEKNWRIHFSQSNGPISHLELRLRAVLSAEFISDIKVKTREGQKAHFKKGKHVAGLAYGYKVGAQRDALGDRITGERVIDPLQAKVVKFIFDSYIRNESPALIADALNKQGVAGPRGDLWRDTTIRGHRMRGTGIINNEMYIGRLIYNRQRWHKDSETEKRVARYNDPSQWLTREDETLRIIDDKRWYEVKARQVTLAHKLPAGAGNRLQGSQRAKYMFSGMIECGECGKGYSIIGKDRYGCSSRRDKLGCTNGRTVSRIVLERRINASIPNALMSINSIEHIQKFAERLTTATDKDDGKAEAQRKRDLAKLQRELENLVSAIRAMGLSPALQAELKAVEAHKLTLEQPIAKKNDPKLGRIPNINAAVMNAALRGLAINAVNPVKREQSEAAAKEWTLLVQSMIDKIVVKAGPEGVLLEVHGQTPALLAAMGAWESEERYVRDKWAEKFNVRQPLSIADGAERTAFLERLNEEIKKRKRSFERFQFGVVAGAGFEPATFRL